MNFSINTKLVLSSVLLVWIFAPTSIYACTCSSFPKNFCNSVGPNETIVLAVITGTPDSHLRDARLIENIHNELDEENFTILGQDGLNCGEVLGDFEIGDTLVLALGIFAIGAEYAYLNGCGQYFLRYSENRVSGLIQTNNIFALQDYQTFTSFAKTCALGVGIEDKIKPQIQIYPTLTTDKITIKAHKNTIDSISIYSFNGELVKQVDTHNQELTLDTMDLPKGVYFVAVQVRNKTITKKVIKL